MSLSKICSYILKSFALPFAVFALAACANVTADLKSADEAARRGDYASATAQWQVLSDYGYDQAQLKLARAYIKGTGVPQDPAAAIPLLESSAKSGNVASLVELGQLYEQGKGVEKNLSTAENYYRQAADRDYPRGSFALGRLYERQKKPSEAVVFYQQAADMGFEPAMEKVMKLQSVPASK